MTPELEKIVAEGVKLEPIGPRFVAVRADVENKSDGGIHIPLKAQERQEGLQPEVVVVRVGDGIPEGKLSVGQRVLLNYQAPQQEFTYKNNKYVIVDWATVKAIYEE